MRTNYIYAICRSCGGDGKHPDAVVDEFGNPIPSGEKDCSTCDGEGKYLWGYIEDKLPGE